MLRTSYWKFYTGKSFSLPINPFRKDKSQKAETDGNSKGKKILRSCESKFHLLTFTISHVDTQKIPL